MSDTHQGDYCVRLILIKETIVYVWYSSSSLLCTSDTHHGVLCTSDTWHGDYW